MIDTFAIPAELEIPPLDRFDLYALLGLVRVMEPETEQLMRERAQNELEEDDYDSPHSRPWFVSFHGSEFPGVQADACERYLVYRMMNFVSATGPVPPWVTTTGVVGKAGELDIADAWFRGGRALAVPEDPEREKANFLQALDAYRANRPEIAEEIMGHASVHQLGFSDPEHWFTVSTDLPILPRGWRRPHIVEIKGQADEVLEEMLNGRDLQRADGTREKVLRGPRPRHVTQLKATLGAAHAYDWGWVTVCPTCWFVVWSEMYERLGLPGGMHPLSDSMGHCPRCHDYASHGPETHFHLDPPTTGEVYYWSRSWPRKTTSFFYDYDERFMRNGLEVLTRVREAYIEDRIPDRPDHFQWSLGPCQFCDFKPFCRVDAGLPPRARKVRPDMVVRRLTVSAGVEQTQSTRPHYNPQKTRERVFAEWATDDA